MQGPEHAGPSPEPEHPPRSGLTTGQAAALLATHGPNALPEPVPPSLLRRFVAQFASPIIYILLAALVFEVAVWVLGEHAEFPIEAAAILGIMLANAALGVWQERKAESAVAKLRDLAAPQVWVMRDGATTRLGARELVPGDQVRMEAGDRVPADGRVAEAHLLALDESIVTGESMPVDKTAGEDVLAGTLVVTGLGSSCYDCGVYDHPNTFYLWGAMGAAAMVGLGLALAGGGDGLVGLSPRRPGSDCEMGKIIFGDETNGHETTLACPSVFHANAGRSASVPVNKS